MIQSHNEHFDKLIAINSVDGFCTLNQKENLKLHQETDLMMKNNVGVQPSKALAHTHAVLENINVNTVGVTSLLQNLDVHDSIQVQLL